MKAWRNTLFWLLAFAALIVFLLVFRTILLPFVAGLALAYALDPLADRIERLGVRRFLASLAILFLFVILFALVIVLVVPVLARQFIGFLEELPTYVSRLQDFAAGLLDSRVARYLGIDVATLRDSFGGIVSSSTEWLTTLLSSIWSGGQALLNLFSLFVITPVVAFYMLNDWDRLVAKVDSWLPRDHVEDIRAIARDMDAAIAAFVRGQGLTCLILGIFYAVSLALVGLNFGLLIGFGAGLMSFIPFVGATLGFIVSVGVALVQFLPAWVPIVMVGAIFVAGQLLEGYVLQPRLIGASVGLHPVWVMFALLAFGVLFGFVGVLIAIPAAAAVGVLVRYALAHYLASPIYRGGAPTGKAPE